MKCFVFFLYFMFPITLHGMNKTATSPLELEAGVLSKYDLLFQPHQFPNIWTWKNQEICEKTADTCIQLLQDYTHEMRYDESLATISEQNIKQAYHWFYGKQKNHKYNALLCMLFQGYCSCVSYGSGGFILYEGLESNELAVTYSLPAALLTGFGLVCNAVVAKHYRRQFIQQHEYQKVTRAIEHFANEYNIDLS